MIKTDVIICPLCGKSTMMEVDDEWSEERIHEELYKICDCEGAKLQQRKMLVKTKMNLLFGESSENSGFEPLDDKAIAHLADLAGDVLGGAYLNVTLTLPTGDKCRIAAVKDKIKISRENKTQAETKI